MRFENRHLAQVGAYLVNCLAAPSDGLVVRRQARDEAQRSIDFEYSFGAGAVPGPRAARIAQGHSGRPRLGCCCWPGWRYSSTERNTTREHPNPHELNPWELSWFVQLLCHRQSGQWSRGCADLGYVPGSASTAHKSERCVVMARATFRQRPPTRGIRAPASDSCRRPELLEHPNGWAQCLKHWSPSPGTCALERFLKNRSRGRQARLKSIYVVLESRYGDFMRSEDLQVAWRGSISDLVVLVRPGRLGIVKR